MVGGVQQGVELLRVGVDERHLHRTVEVAVVDVERQRRGPARSDLDVPARPQVPEHGEQCDRRRRRRTRRCPSGSATLRSGPPGGTPRRPAAPTRRGARVGRPRSDRRQAAALARARKISLAPAIEILEVRRRRVEVAGHHEQLRLVVRHEASEALALRRTVCSSTAASRHAAIRRSTGTRRAIGITRSAAARPAPSARPAAPVGSVMAGQPTRRSVARTASARSSAIAHVTKYRATGTARLFWRRGRAGTVRQIGQSEALTVAFHGVRGSTPCHGDEIRRYGGNTSSVSLTRARERSDPVRPRHGRALLRPRPSGRPVVQGLVPAEPPALGPHAGSAVLHAAAPCRVRARRVRAVAGRGRTVYDVMTDTIRPPLFPITLAELPGEIRFHDVADSEFSIGEFDVMSRLIPHIGRTCGYRVTWQGHSVSYLSDHQQPLRRFVHRHAGRDGVVRGRRHLDPRRAVHAGRVPARSATGAIA